MLMPKKVKYRKQQRGRMAGKAWRGSDVSFGDYGLKALEPCWLTDRQIEAARVAMTRFIARGGKIWTRVFPDKPITKKPQETRMGKGKGAPEQWVCVVRPGRVLFEMEGVTEKDAREAMRLAAAKLPASRRRRCYEGRRTARPRNRRARRQGTRPHRSVVPDAHPEVDGTARSAGQDAYGTPRSRAREDRATTEAERIAMAQKSEKVGVVVSNKMQKSIVVAVEWQVRDGLYGKTQRRTSKFMVHDEENAAKIGDTVAITETRPMSRRKRWALARVVRTSAQV